MKSWKKNSIIITISLILIGVAGWAFYKIINTGAEDLLLKVGIENVYYQSIVVIVIVLALLTLLGFGFKKTLKKILKSD